MLKRVSPAFEEMLKRCSKEKYYESQRQEYLDKRQRRGRDQKSSCRQDETETGIPG